MPDPPHASSAVDAPAPPAPHAPTPPPTPAHPATHDHAPRGRPRRLTPADCLTVARLHQRGHSYAAIAQALDATPAQVKTALADARQLLEAHAGRFAADWIRASAQATTKGDHRPARDALAALGVVQPAASGALGGVQVQVNFAFAGLPAPRAADHEDSPADRTRQTHSARRAPSLPEAAAVLPDVVVTPSARASDAVGPPTPSPAKPERPGEGPPEQA